MKQRSIVICLIVAISLLVLVSPASAQVEDLCFHITFGSSTNAGCYEWDEFTHTLPAFITEEGDCSGTHGHLAGNNAEGDSITCESFVQDFLIVNVTLPEGCIVTSWNAPYSVDGPGRTTIYNYDETDDYDFSNNVPVNTGGAFVDWSPGTWNSIGGETGMVWLAAGTSGGTASPVRYDYIEFVCDAGSAEPPSGSTYGGPFQPIAEELQVEVVTPRNGSGIVNGASRITANTSSAMLGATPVYASITGTIGNVTPNSIELLGEINGEDWEVLYRNLEKIYVQPGDAVDAGCIIALAAPATTQTTESESDDLKGLSFRIINLDLESFEDWELFSSPSGTRLCGSLVKGDSCLNANPYLNNNADVWNVAPSDTGIMPQRGDGAISLIDNQTMFQYAALDEGETYYVTIAARMLDVPVGGRSALLHITLGDDFDNYTIYADLPGDIPKGNPPPGEQQVFVVGPFEPTTTDLAPDLYKLSIENNAALSKVEINYVCLSESDTSPIAPYSSCYFDQLGDFSTTGETMHDTFGNEFIALDDTEAITYEDLTLSGYDDADAEYHIEVMLSASDEDQSSAAASTSPELTLSYNDGTEYAVVDTVTIPYYVRQFKMITLTIEIPEDEIVTADLVIAHDQQASTDSEFIYVSNICLIAPTGWPGYDSAPPGSGGGSSGGGSGSCAPVIAPLSTDIWEWIAWLFSSLTRFFECVLPAELKKILNAVVSIGAAITDFGRWLLAVFQLLASFLISLFVWLVTALSNALIAILTAIWSAIIQIPLFTEFFDIWSLLDLLIDGVTSVLLAAINLVLLGFKTLATFAQIMLAFWVSLAAAINDTTTATTGLPDCETILDTDLWYPTCLTIDLISYIIAAFPNIQYSILAAGALLAIYTLIKTMSWYRDSFAEVS